jgi:CRP-like cAMP-binding protein
MVDPDILRAIPFLRELSTEDLAAFAGLLTSRECKPKERVLVEGEPPDAFYIICDGVVHAKRNAQKREMLLGTIGTGGFFGEINLFDPGVATASIVAMTNVRLAVITYAQFRAFMEERPTAGFKIVSTLMIEMSKRLRKTNQRLVNAEFWKPEGNTPA